jgi:hypothetical protein
VVLLVLRQGYAAVVDVVEDGEIFMPNH